ARWDRGTRTGQKLLRRIERLGLPTRIADQQFQGLANRHVVVDNEHDGRNVSHGRGLHETILLRQLPARQTFRSLKCSHRAARCHGVEGARSLAFRQWSLKSFKHSGDRGSIGRWYRLRKNWPVGLKVDVDNVPASVRRGIKNLC